jgi:hypothetical protein
MCEVCVCVRRAEEEADLEVCGGKVRLVQVFGFRE